MSNPRRIIFINQDSGYLMIDIINAFVNEGYSCVLLTGRLVSRNINLHSSVRIENIIRYNRSTVFKRLWTWSIGFIQLWIKIILKFRSDDLFIVSNPPMAPLLPVITRNPFQLLIFDIYPDALSELGYLSANSILLKKWRKANRKVFAKAKRIFTISEGMRNVLQQYVTDFDIKVVPVWTDNTFLRPVKPAENPFRIKHQLTGKFIVMYSGNLGLASNIELIINVANEIRDENICFLIIGDGAIKKQMISKARNFELENIEFLPWQPVEELPYSLASADLAVISLGIKASRLAVPSKLYNFLSVGAPLMCITEEGSEIERLVKNYKCGKSFEPDDIRGMTAFISEISTNSSLRNSMMTNSLKASKDFNVSNVKMILEAQHN